MFVTVCVTPTEAAFADTFCAMGTHKTRTYGRNEVIFRLSRNFTDDSVYKNALSRLDDVYTEIGQEEENVMIYRMKHTLADEVNIM